MLVLVRGAPLDGLVLPHELGSVGKVRVLVVNISVRVVANYVLVVPHPGAAEPREEVGQDGVDAPVAAHREVEAVVPVVGNDDPGKLRGGNEGPPLSGDVEGQAREEGRHEREDHQPPLGGGLGGLPEGDAPGLGDGSEVVHDHLLDIEGEGVLLVLVPAVVRAVVPGVNRLEVLGHALGDLVLLQDAVKLLVGDEVVVGLEERRRVPALGQVERDGASRMLELGEVVPDSADAGVKVGLAVLSDPAARRLGEDLGSELLKDLEEDKDAAGEDSGGLKDGEVHAPEGVEDDLGVLESVKVDTLGDNGAEGDDGGGDGEHRGSVVVPRRLLLPGSLGALVGRLPLAEGYHESDVEPVQGGGLLVYRAGGPVLPVHA
mmetsp:Transcript_25689/g.53399  ORF Transcript_25689/g.53399 Transcript_25689/m.53399 type:complete len:375 (+) Transcript_25689:853-1977(+)